MSENLYRPILRRAALLAALVLLYFAGGKVGLGFAQINSSASAVWPPTGIALAAVLLLGRQALPAIFLGALMVNLTTTGLLGTSIAIALGNTLEAALGAHLVRRHAGGLACFATAGNTFRYVALAAFFGTAVCATIGTGTLVLGGVAEAGSAAAIWLTWWLGDAVGALTLAPLAILWHQQPRLRFDGRGREALLMYLGVLAIGVIVFLQHSYPISFLCLAPLAWAAFRFGQREVVTVIVIISSIAIWGTSNALGPFALGPPDGSLLILHAFIGTLCVMMLPIAALVAQQRDAAIAATRAIAEAATANRAKDEFLSMLSHELRNPLHAISNAAGLLQQPAHRDPAALQALQIIRRQTDHLSRIVVDLLDVTRALAGTISLSRRAVNIADAINKVMDELAAAGRRQTHDITVDSETVWVSADPMRLHQVLSGLMDNALKFTPKGGMVHLLGQREGDEAVIRVEDNGMGIAADLQLRLFQPFAQGERGLDRSEGGLGIGLTLTRKVVEQHGGRVEVQSGGTGLGTTVVVRLPRIEMPALVEVARPGAAPNQSRLVLIVEDNEDARLSLRALLEAVGHRVLEARDGQEGIEQALRLRPDVMLVDIGLPGVDGYEVARQLRARGGAPRLIALTGYGRPEDRQRSSEAGFDEHLVKPVSLEQLQESLAEPRKRA